MRMRDQSIDMWETFFLVLSLFATMLPSMAPYLAWLAVMALGIQLFDFVSSPDHVTDLVVLIPLALAIATMVCPVFTPLAQYTQLLLAISLLAQLYDDYAS